jgi:serine/threonine-protein kinase
MELVDGCSLHELVDVDRLSMRRAVNIALAVLDALAAAHEAGIVHRDVKPGNIMLAGTDVDGSSSLDRVKLVDFGISKVKKADGMELTRSNIAMGSPGYAAPEQYVSARDVDARADVYGVGVVLYRALTGELPFDADSYEQMVLRVCTVDPEPLARRLANAPAALTAAVDRAIARDRNARHESAAAFASALRAVLPLLLDEHAAVRTPAEAFAPTIATDGTGPRPAVRDAAVVLVDSGAQTGRREPASDPTLERRTSPARETPTTRVSQRPAGTSARGRSSIIIAASLGIAVLVIGGASAFVLLGREDGDEVLPPTPAASASETLPAEPPASEPPAGPEPEAEPASASEPDSASASASDSASDSEAAPPAHSRPSRRSTHRTRATRAMTEAPEEPVASMDTASMRQEFGTEDLEPF